MKKLYLISQDENRGYDTYDAVVVCADNEEEARNIKPDFVEWGRWCSSWASSPEKVDVKYIGVADESIEKGVVLSSFNAG